MEIESWLGQVRTPDVRERRQRARSPRHGRTARHAQESVSHRYEDPLPSNKVVPDVERGCREDTAATATPEWTELRDPDGNLFYFNNRTLASQVVRCCPTPRARHKQPRACRLCV